MARLNEAPTVVAPPTESVEALKRRFVRQNRDLARINTQQSMRIRALELEQSHLQAENLSLREEVLRLQHQLSDGLGRSQVGELQRIRTELEQQLQAVCQVAAQLGQFDILSERQERIPNPASWRPEKPMLRLAGQEMPLPPIVEDKMYPRRTLGADEIRTVRLSDQSTDSPDLGPPPVAHFDCSDPIKFDRSRLVREQTDDEPRDIPVELSVNLETRRKRRETLPRPIEDEDLEQDTLTVDDVKQRRTSQGTTSRRLSIRDLSDVGHDAATEPFSFTRKSSPGSPTTVDSKKSPPAAELITESTAETLQPVIQPRREERRVLGDKSTNSSPRKVVVGKKPLKNTSKATPDTAGTTEVVKARVRRPKATPSVIEIQPDIDPSPAEVEIEVGPPATPKGLDFFSPGPSEPSSVTNSHTSDAVASANLEGIRRPSRRARAVASYAEPSLNTKMRRSTVELVDAVYPAGRRQSGAAGTSVGGSTVKDEAKDDDDAWKALLTTAIEPNSPLGGKLSNASMRLESPTMTRPKAVSPNLLTKRADKTLTDGLAAGMRDLAVTEKPRRRVSSVASRRHSSIAFDTPNSPPSFSDTSSPATVDTVEIKSLSKQERTASRRRSMVA